MGTIITKKITAEYRAVGALRSEFMDFATSLDAMKWLVDRCGYGHWDATMHTRFERVERYRGDKGHGVVCVTK